MADINAAQKGRLQKDLRAVITDLEDLLGATASQAGDQGIEVRHRIQARLQQAKAAGRSADDYVHDNPWRVIGAAAGIGLVLGLLIGRR